MSLNESVEPDVLQTTAPEAAQNIELQFSRQLIVLPEVRMSPELFSCITGGCCTSSCYYPPCWGSAGNRRGKPPRHILLM